MMTKTMTATDDSLPPIPDFDPRRTRRAVRRGLFRTALRSAALLLGAALLLNAGTALLQTRGDRDQRMERVLGSAFLVAHPDYTSGMSALDFGLTSMTLTVDADPVEPVPAPDEVTRRPGTAAFEITQNLLGQVTDGVYGLQTRLSGPLGLTGERTGTREEARGQAEKVFGRLPASLLATAVVEFERPLTGEEFAAFHRDRYEQDDPTAPAHTFLLSRASGGSTYGVPFGWQSHRFGSPATGKEEDYDPAAEGAKAVGDFRRWVGELRDHDAENLLKLGVPLKNLRAAATEGRIHGYVAAGETVEGLREILDDPRVRTVRLGDVAFDLS
ncbi:hypothetical protein OG339_08100 [Streptosporangium sp. NBC_01495]|uniref:hypothetical protein n=1 Tax=Streptosporangium sp. NBC_01495 TaxID=2903899 RepID=UPI002E309FB2|nr:hypothetical protein [Streptosporangium sp. NBC_01495]